METTFAGDIEILVLRDGREITRVIRPLRRTAHGPVVRYKKRLWPVNGNTINIAGKFVPEEGDASDVPEAPALARIQIQQSSTPQVDAPMSQEEKDDQEKVITAGAEQRMLVDAGPGTGKTYAACMRVAALIRDNVPAPRIWIISFTRTAVHEIRNRLAGAIGDADEAASVTIATLDSLAWSIHSGFSQNATLTGSYDDNIQQTIAKITRDEDARAALGRVRHLVVDEAQDIVGQRAELVLGIIGALREDCGVTVFADEAQAIYGWTEDEKKEADAISLLAELDNRNFERAMLKEVRRTDSPELLKIFRDVRRRVLDLKTAALERGREVRSQITGLAHARLGPSKELKLTDLPANGLVLMRQRCDVLLISSYNQKEKHRLRMSGLPARILPWLGLLLCNHVERRLTRTAFDDRWAKGVAAFPGVPDPDAAWRLLVEAAGESTSVIDIHKLRRMLSRPAPPAPFTSPEYGDEGPIVGTIHASKGREAEEVWLYLPPDSEEYDEDESDQDGDPDEEIRVMFVGATRARKKLSVGDSPGRQSGSFEGRVWKRIPYSKKLQLEIGRAYDIDAEGLVGRSNFRSAAEALKAQKRLVANPWMTGMFASEKAELDYALALETPQPESMRIGVLSAKVKSDLRGIANRCESWPPPNFLPHIRSMGLRTIVLKPDDPNLDRLHEPWRSSGVVLAPMLAGFCLTKLRG